MSNKMLIDASHPEETRVVVVRGNRIEEFDFESEHKKQLKGNIYLARVTRVEPSLQAAFVEYGGNRHGFLAFSEIHPDYYQIPVADRAALLEAEAQAASQEDEEDEENLARERQEKSSRRRRRGRGSGKAAKQVPEETASDEDAIGDEQAALASSMPAEIAADRVSEAVEPEEEDDPVPHSNADVFLGEAPSIAEISEENGNGNGDDEDGDEEDGEANGEREEVESVGAEDALEEVPTRQRVQRKQYKIQEVIKRRQILLVQVVKEERGNKGAALTTYLSLAGRYSVLMPNTARGGGISRKITSPQDRKRLKEIVKDLAVPQGMGVILRTAGANRTKAEVKRDYEYLTRLWDTVRNLTLESTAPTLVYEEGSLIKRSIRDLYNKDISEILVAGEDGYREAKDFMRMLMPSHAKVVQPYREPIPIFARSGIEAQLDKMLQPQVTLKSGGYIIINQTEALVAIDVNSGRSTREHSIEDTALQTNLEAADEVARQLRLRDLAGLIVIDFIDMEEKRNNRAVEKRLKDCLKNDRARIQVGRISHFGLLEMSRQRIRASVLESTMQVCAICGGTGHVRSPSSVALHVIRSIEEYLLRHPNNDITVRTPVETALYVLNNKRQNLADLEARFGLTIDIKADEEVGSQHLAIDKGPPASGVPQNAGLSHPGFGLENEVEEEEVPVEAETETEGSEAADERRGRKRRRRSKRRRGDRDETAAGNEEVSEAQAQQGEEARDGDEASAEGSTDDQPRKKRRRGRRGGRKNRRDGEAQTVAANDDIGAADEGSDEAVEAAPEPTAEEPASEQVAEPVAEAAPAAAASEEVSEPAEAPKPKRPRRRTRAAAVAEEPQPDTAEAPQPTVAEEARPEAAAAEVEAKEETKAEPATQDANGAAEPEKPRRSRRRATASETAAEPVVTSVTPQEATDEEPAAPKRGGWWQKKGFF